MRAISPLLLSCSIVSLSGCGVLGDSVPAPHSEKDVCCSYALRRPIDGMLSPLFMRGRFVLRDLSVPAEGVSDSACRVDVGRRCGARSPGAAWSPALLESVDQWSLTIPETQIPGGSRPVGSAVRRRCPRGPDPPPEGHMPQLASARKGGLVGSLRADWR